ncbi:MAG: ABC transporter substrate-binding protein, partial [Thermoanaerobaculia bacterium]
MGLDSEGKPLHVAMPRFRMSHEDMADLVAYMKKLGLEGEAGVSDQEVRIGLVLPPAGPLTPLGETVRAALAERFERINREGGVYGRRLALRTFEPPAGPASRGAVAGFLEREEIFAGVAAFFAGADAELAALFSERQVPLIGPFTLHTPDASPNRHVFYLHPGTGEQVRALAGFACSRPDLARPAVLAPAEASLGAMVEAIGQACPRWPSATVLRYPAGSFDPGDLARRLEEADPVFFLGSGQEAVALARALEGRPPHLLLTGGSADGSLFAAPRSFQDRIILAIPDLAPGSESLQRTALAAAEVLHEGLRRAGRDLTRERLIEALEGLRAFPTGLSQPVTYGPGHRLGIRQPWLVSLDLEGRKLVPVPREP